MKKYDLVIFDCDGTLVDSHYMNHSVMADIANEYADLNYSVESVTRDFLGVDFKTFCQHVEEQSNEEITDNLPQICLQRVLGNIDKAQPISGVKETLEILAPHYKFAIASNANFDIVINSLKVSEIFDYFNSEYIVAGRLMAKTKPAPDLFLKAAELRKVNPSRCLVIEDSQTGVQAAVAAGMDTLGFTGVSHDKKAVESALKTHGAMAVFDEFIHMRKYLSL